MEIKIDPEFKALIPPLSQSEREGLEKSCIKEGVRDPLVLWGETLIDGHNRYDIAQANNLPFQTVSREFESRLQAMEWIINNQFSRRNLPTYVRGELVLKLEPYYREKARESQGERTDLNLCVKSHKGSIDTKKELAKKSGIGEQTMSRIMKINKKADPETKQKLRSGDLSVNQVYKQIKKEEKKENFRVKTIEFNKVRPESKNHKIIHGDAVNAIKQIKDNSIDLLLTDPPYGMDFKSGWSNHKKVKNDKIKDTEVLLDIFLSKVVTKLKDNSHFYIFGSIDYIEDIKPIIENHLILKQILIWDRKVIGMGDLKSYGKSFDVIYFGYKKVFRPLNGPRHRDVLAFDRVQPNQMTHPTEKPLDLLSFLIKKSTNPADLVLDPFAGSGSTLEASKINGRNSISIEIEDEYIPLINKKI